MARATGGNRILAGMGGFQAGGCGSRVFPWRGRSPDGAACHGVAFAQGSDEGPGVSEFAAWMLTKATGALKAGMNVRGRWKSEDQRLDISDGVTLEFTAEEIALRSFDSGFRQ